MTGHEYEYFVAKYLRQHGYSRVEVTKGSGDYGIDVVAYKKGKKYAVQCKYYSKPVSLSAVQEAVAGKAMYNCDSAMVVTNSTFTASAIDLATANNVVLLAQVDKAQIHTTHTSLFSLIKQKILDKNAAKQINRVIKPGTLKKHFCVKGEIDKEQKYSQTVEHHGALHNSAITGLPHKFTITGNFYDIDKIDDVRIFPLNFSSFHINGTKYFFNDYFRLCAKFYRDEGYVELANALEAKAVEIETAPLFGLYVKENSKTVIEPPQPTKCISAEKVQKTLSEIDVLFDISDISVLAEADTLTTSKFQRTLKIGYARAARIVDFLLENGIIEQKDLNEPYIYKWSDKHK